MTTFIGLALPRAHRLGRFHVANKPIPEPSARSRKDSPINMSSPSYTIKVVEWILCVTATDARTLFG